MGFFQQVEGVACVLSQNGGFTQNDIYKRDGYLYAKSGNVFIRLNRDGSTTKPKVRLDHMTFDDELYSDAMGRLCTAEVKTAKPLDHKVANQLLLGVDA
jgi:hypothetical protein